MRHAKKNGFERYKPITIRIAKAIWFLLNLVAIIKTIFD